MPSIYEPRVPRLAGRARGALLIDAHDLVPDAVGPRSSPPQATASGISAARLRRQGAIHQGDRRSAVFEQGGSRGALHEGLGISIAAVLPRGDVRDAFISAKGESPATLPPEGGG